MAKRVPKPEFEQQLATIRKARRSVDKAILTLEETRKIHEQTRTLVREMLFDHVCLCQELLPKMEDLGEASSIVSRAVQSLQRMEEWAEKATENKVSDAQQGLPVELREELERSLNLM